MKPTRSIESLSSAIDSAASPSTSPAAQLVASAPLDTSLGRIQPFPSTSVLHSIKAQGSTQPKPPPEPRVEPEPEEDELESDDDDDGKDDEPREEEPEPESPKEELVLPLDEVQEEEDGVTKDEREGSAEVEGSSSSDGSDASDSDDGEEEEPTLKYSRLGGGTVEILAKDSASALAISTKYIVRLAPLQLLPLTDCACAGSRNSQWSHLYPRLSRRHRQAVPSPLGHDQRPQHRHR